MPTEEVAESYLASLDLIQGVPPQTEAKILASIILLLIFIFARWLGYRLVKRYAQTLTQQYHWRRLVNYGVTVFAMLFIGRLWFPGIESLATFLGIISAGLLIALQAPIVNLVGWLFILFRRPFQVGDRISIGDDTGDVIDISLFQITLMEVGNWVGADQSTGRMLHIPNGKVFRDTLANSTKGFDYLWKELPILVTFESDWEKAKTILSQICETEVEVLSTEAESQLKRVAEKYLIFFNVLTPIVYTSVQDSGVLLTIRYLTKVRARRATSQRLWEAILREFAKHDDIDFAYPSVRYYDNRREGKLGAGGLPPPISD